MLTLYLNDNPDADLETPNDTDQAADWNHTSIH